MKETIGVYSFWFNRGLAHLAQDFVELLKTKYNIKILARVDNSLDHGKRDKRVTYEDTTTISNWVKENGIDKLLVFQFLDREEEYRKVKQLGIELYIVPMIEWVGKNETTALDLFNNVLCPTKYTYNVIQSLKDEKIINNPQITFLPYFINPDCFKDVKLCGPNNRILFDVGWGGWQDRKNIEFALMVMCMIKTKLKLVFKTQKPLKEYHPLIHSLINILKDEGRIEVVEGDLPFSELLDLRSTCQFQLSTTGFTGLELAPQEALAINQTMIVMNAPPINEVITDAVGIRYQAGWMEPMGHNFIYKYKPKLISLKKILEGLRTTSYNLQDGRVYLKSKRKLFEKKLGEIL